jgi:hypothetical protein
MVGVLARQEHETQTVTLAATASIAVAAHADEREIEQIGRSQPGGFYGRRNPEP